MTAYGKKTFYERVMDRQAEMESERRVWDVQRQEIIEHYRPDLTVLSGESRLEEGQFLHSSIVEGTGAWAAMVMARGFLSSMVGPSLKWFRDQMRQMRLRGVDTINAWLQRLDDYLREGVYQPSNFYEVIGPDVLDGITVGSPVMLVEENTGKRRIEYKLPHHNQNYLMRDWFGNDTAYHRKFHLSNLKAAQQFGKEKLPPAIQEELDLGVHFKKHEYLQVIYEAGDPILADFEDEKNVLPLAEGLLGRPRSFRPWMQFYFTYKVSDARYRGAMKAEGYFHKPFCPWHYWRNAHETYARTPAWYGIFDEKGGQSAWTTMHDMAQRAADPPMVGLFTMKGRTGPAFMSPGRWSWAKGAEEYDRPPKRIETADRYPHAIEFVDRLDDKRKRHFNIDLFRMIDEYSREHTEPPTAFQIAQMMAEKNAQIGPAVESFVRGLLEPVHNRIMEIEARSGRLFRETNPPMELLGMTLEDVMPMFTGPLAQAQKVAVAMRRVTDPLGMAAPIFELWPDAKYKIKPDVLLERILEDLDFYQDAMATQEEYDAIMDVMSRQRAQQRSLEQAALMADAVPKLQKASEDGSPIKELAGAA